MSLDGRSAIYDIIAQLWFDIDHHDGASAQLYFTDGATLTFDARTFTGRSAIAQVYADRKVRGPRLSRHLISNLVMEMSDAGVATVHHVSTLYATDGVAPGSLTLPAAVADVDDVLTQASEGEAWQIAERVWRTVFIAPDTQLAVPTK